MPDILETIKAHKQTEIAEGKGKETLAELEARARNKPAPRGFAAALEKEGINIIAELKKASPSRGLIRHDFDPELLAQACEGGGAACLSVLTDSRFFQGAEGYLKQARASCSLPVLQKDFFYDIWQVVKARALGADAILLIMASLEQTQAQELALAAKEWQLDVLPEVHNEAELEMALTLNTKLIGINNRDLRTFDTALSTTRELSPLVPEDKVVVCESGIHTKADITAMAKLGIHAFLIGESLMKQANVKTALKELL